MASKQINGTGADDQLQGTSGADQIKGNAGNDMLLGLAGNDDLDGGVGNDTMDGGAGNDLLSGGKGADLFISSFGDILVSIPPEGTTEAHIHLFLGDDVISDFELGTDHLQMLAGSSPVVVTLDQLTQKLMLTETDTDGDGKLDTVVTIDYVDEYGVHYTDDTSSITLLGVSGASIAQLYAGG